ncbi:MAG: response regulator [Chloroflexota bacterium]
MRILYVEDNATNVILVQRVANMGRHAVINYDDGQVALDRFEQDKPDLILLDVQLRGALTGLDVAHALRTKGCTLPIMAVTAYAMKGDRQRCLDAGCDDYLPKPISVAELVTVFKRYGDAAAAGKPIVSTFKFPTPTTTAPANLVTPPIILTPLPVAVVVEPAVAVVDASPTVIAPAPVIPSVELTPPSVDILPIVTPAAPNPVTPVERPTITPSADPLAHRAPTPVNAEP